MLKDAPEILSERPIRTSSIPIQVADRATLTLVRERFWDSRAVRFGEFEFRPETGEVLERGVVVARLSETESETLMVLIKVYPLPIPRQGLVREMRRIGCYWHPDTAKVVVSRLRSKLGAAIIETHTRGYLFTPDVWMGAA